jgi:hypothetical protein
MSLSENERKEIVVNSEEYKILKWKYEFTQDKVNNLLKIINDDFGIDETDRIIKSLGCACAKAIPFIVENKGKLDSYFTVLKEKWGEIGEINKDQNEIILTTPERDCVCPLIKKGETSSQFCNCSLGWQKFAYETILDKKVEVEILESILRGSRKCKFRIRIIE